MSLKRLAALIAVFLVINSALSQAAEDIGSAKQLFIDDYIIDSLGRAERVFKQAVKSKPVLSARPAWETNHQPRRNSLRQLAYRTKKADVVSVGLFS
jgi:hypothetical protein